MEINVNDADFDQEVLRSDIPVFVDFWAPWCGPCRMVKPLVEGIAQEYAGKIKVCKVNVDEANRTAVKYQVMSIPTLAVFKNGELAEKNVGALPKPDIEKMIKAHI